MGIFLKIEDGLYFAHNKYICIELIHAIRSCPMNTRPTRSPPLPPGPSGKARPASDGKESNEGDDASPGKAQRGVQSIEVGGSLLRALAQLGRPSALKDLAAAADMPPAKAHPYLVSLGKVGLIEQDSASGRYGLGPLAMELGLISLQQYDPVRLASPRLPELAQQLQLTVALAVWGNLGPTIVRLEEAPTAVHVNMRHGTVMSLRGTASGLLFAAFHAEDEVLAVLSREQGGTVSALDAALQTAVAEVRQQGYARVMDGAVAGIHALAAPVFNGQGELVLSLTAIGPAALLGTGAQSPSTLALKAAAQGLSRQLGWRPGA
jgi:DNA-binding IclR family transcriptional regulator